MHNFVKTFSIISFGLFFLNSSLSFAEEKVVTLGGKEGWSRIERKESVTEGIGRYGHPSMTLDTNSRKVSDDVDLLIDFEGNRIYDSTGHYSVVSNSLLTVDSAKMGKGSALSRGNGGLRLDGNSDSIFGSSGVTGSFLIEFWLNPSVGENGETVFSWRSSRTENSYVIYQMINVSFFQNHLEWLFANVFNGYEENNGEIRLPGSSTLIPDVWSHHALSYDCETGLLEYRINGRLEGMKYVTSNGRETGGSVYTPILGVAADIDICPQYTGLMDDFCIRRTNESETAVNMRYDSFKRDGGRFESEPIKISTDAKLTRLDAVVSEPAQTNVVFYVRSGDNQYSWDENYPEWIPVSSGEKLRNVKGLYFQVAADLFPDGSGEKTPSVMQIDLHFDEVEPPLPPFRVSAVAGDGRVTLTWSYSVDSYTGGYYVYYGDRPGEYICRDAALGDSPIDVGNTNSVTITGLRNGKVYYFAVAAYSSVDEKIIGVLSKEVYARPLRK